MASDPQLLDAFRKQCIHLRKSGTNPGLALLAWEGQPGVDRDDLIDILKEVERDGE